MSNRQMKARVPFWCFKKSFHFFLAGEWPKSGHQDMIELILKELHGQPRQDCYAKIITLHPLISRGKSPDLSHCYLSMLFLLPTKLFPVAPLIAGSSSPGSSQLNFSSSKEPSQTDQILFPALLWFPSQRFLHSKSNFSLKCDLQKCTSLHYTVEWISTGWTLHNQHPDQVIAPSLEAPTGPLPVTTAPKRTTTLTSNTVWSLFPVCELYRSGILLYILFYVWLALLPSNTSCMKLSCELHSCGWICLFLWYEYTATYLFYTCTFELFPLWAIRNSLL